ncbi:MAG: TadE/TadG family type IV pilus assembly protein [Rickettsiales bacterium]|nr:TadE/TadG family type IV pilus assembly protein [Rickettsiales bacterium]
MNNFIKKFRKNKDGSVLIEMAFILPMFLFLTLAIFEFAIIFFYSFVLESAMYNVTRFAKIQPNPTVVEQQVRDLIGQKSLGLMDPNKVIITTALNVDFEDDWENAEPEKCVDPTNSNAVIPGSTCANTNECNGFWLDVKYPSECNIGPPPLQLGAPGDIISYVAFYKKPLFTPGLGLFILQDAGSFLNSSSSAGESWHLISSATVTRNEP